MSSFKRDAGFNVRELKLQIEGCLGVRGTVRGIFTNVLCTKTR